MEKKSFLSMENFQSLIIIHSILFVWGVFLFSRNIKFQFPFLINLFEIKKIIILYNFKI